RRVLWPTHLFDRLLERQAYDLLTVQMGDEVVCLNAGFVSGRTVDRSDDLNDAILHRDLDAEAPKLAARLHLHVAEVLRAEISRMRVERGQHAVDGRLDQLCVVRLLDVVLSDALEHITKQVELPVDLRVRR